MIIWLALLIPVITTIVLILFFKHKTLWWEFLIPFVASVILIGIMKVSTEYAQTSDTEYWGEPIYQAIHSEAWDEEVSCRHSYDCNCSTDSKGHKSCSTCYEHSYDVDYHPEYWQIVTASGRAASISSAEYHRLVQKWGGEKFVNQNRDYHSIDGDWYVATCPNEEDKIECFVSSHSYENRVQACDNVVNFPEITEEDLKFYKLFEYPDIINGYQQKGILGFGDKTQEEAERKVQIINATLGPKKQVKLFILVYRNVSDDIVYKQECFWKGGNKNEFVVCIGIDNLMNVKWCKPFSFTENQEIKIETRNFVKQMGKLNLVQVVDFLKVEINKNFKRKSFKEFDYLTVEPKAWQVILTFVLTLLINIGLSIWIIKNDIE